MKHSLTALFFSVLLISVSLPAVAGGVPSTVSMVQLIADPSKYEAVLINVTGYLVYSPQGDQKQAYLYFDKEQAEANNSSNAISLEIPQSVLQFIEEYEDEYVNIIGTFDAKNRGPWGFNIGTISTISCIKLAPSVTANQKYMLHAYALPIVEIQSSSPEYSAIKNLMLSWMTAIQSKNYPEIAKAFDMDEKQEEELKNDIATQRANWLLFDSKSSIYKRFNSLNDFIFRLFKHDEPGYSESLYACLFSKVSTSEQLYNLTNQLPGIYGESKSICVDVLKVDAKFSISFLPFASPTMK